jgi:hypothetical protein
MPPDDHSLKTAPCLDSEALRSTPRDVCLQRIRTGVGR